MLHLSSLFCLSFPCCRGEDGHSSHRCTATVVFCCWPFPPRLLPFLCPPSDNSLYFCKGLSSDNPPILDVVFIFSAKSLSWISSAIFNSNQLSSQSVIINCTKTSNLCLQTGGRASGTGGKGSAGTTEDLGRGRSGEVSQRATSAAGFERCGREYGPSQGRGPVAGRGRSHRGRGGRRTGQAQGHGGRDRSGEKSSIQSANFGSFECYAVLFSGVYTHPLVSLITLNRTPS